MKKCRCVSCGEEFTRTEKDLSFYVRLNVPPPQLCPDCRQFRRILHINQLNLFKRTCDATGQPIISNHPPYVPYPVHAQSHWYSDAVDNLKIGQEIDFTRPFFDQFAELSRRAARPALFTDFTRDENSAFTNYGGKNKDCYLIFDSDCNRDCLYSYSLNACTNTIDTYRGDKLELCYQAIDCHTCYECTFIQNCQGCSASSYLVDCISLRNSLFCVNAQQKTDFLFNKQVTPEEIESVREALKDPIKRNEYMTQYNKLCEEQPRKAMQGVHNEDCTGNYLSHCKEAHACFDSRSIWNGSYIYQAFMSLKDSMDCNEVGEAELLYECVDVGYNAYNCKFTINCLNQISDLTYCDYCFLGCHDLFGCIGLKRNSYCILNIAYSEAEYRTLSSRLIQHMKETGEWGQFFPEFLSPFAYNHSHASLFYPMDQDTAEKLNLRWFAEQPPVTLKSGCKRCELCNGSFLITKVEKEFYQKYSLPEPDICFLCRHKDRLSKREPRILQQTKCLDCGLEVWSPFHKTRSIIRCNDCFNKARL